MTRHHRPHITVVLAMSADGKIADAARSPARFGSDQDRAHLEARLAEADGVVSGASTLRAYGTILPIRTPALLQARRDRQQPPQPTYIICSRSGNLAPTLRFFRQPVPRWLLTADTSPVDWSTPARAAHFHRILTVPAPAGELDWAIALAQLVDLGMRRLVVAGGGQLVASLLAIGAIDDLWLTLCPLLLGGQTAPTPVDGSGWAAAVAPRLHLISAESHDAELFLHYRVKPSHPPRAVEAGDAADGGC